MQVSLPDKLDASLISAQALYGAEKAGHRINIQLEFTKGPHRLVWERHALVDLNYVMFCTGRNYQAVKKWTQRGNLTPVKVIGTAPLFDAAFVEHLLQTEQFASGQDDLCEAAWIARAFWAWVPRDGLKAAPNSPASRIEAMPFMAELTDFVNERLDEVEALRRADMAAKAKKQSA